MVVICSRASRNSLFLALALTLAAGVLLAPAPLLAQEPLPPPAESFIDLPPQYEAMIVDLVERYEEMRELLRSERMRTENLYSAAEIDAATASLQAELDAAQRDVRHWQRAYKAVVHTAKRGHDDARYYKSLMVKELEQQQQQYANLRSLYDAVQPERLFSAGATFYPEGYLGALLQVRMPGSPLGFYAEGLYRTREQDYFYGFGVSYSFLSHRTVVEGWDWLRSLFTSRPRRSATSSPEASAAAGAGGKASTFGSGVQLPESPRP